MSEDPIDLWFKREVIVHDDVLTAYLRRCWPHPDDIHDLRQETYVRIYEAARERIFDHSLKLEDARAYAVYGQNSFVGKILEIHQELPGRTHVVLVRQSVGF